MFTPPSKQSGRTSALRLLRQELVSLHWRYPAFIALTGFLALVSTLPPRLFVFFSDSMADLRLGEVPATSFIKELFIFGAIVAVVTLVANLLWTLAEEWIFLAVEANLRRRVLARIHRMPVEDFDKTQRGDWMTRISSDLKNTESFVAVSLPTQFRNAVVLALITGFFAQRDPGVAASILGSALVLALLNALIQRKLTPAFETLRTMHGDVFQTLLESYEGVRTIKSLRIEGRVEASFDVKVRRVAQRGMAVVKSVGLLTGGNSFFTNAVTTACLCLVAWRFQGASFTLADALNYPFYLSMFFGAALGLTNAALDWNHFFVESGRIGAILDVASHEQKSTGSIDDVVVIDPEKVTQFELQGTTFGYSGEPRLTTPFNFSLKRGDIVLIKGHSGCGKSTFLEVLAGLRACEATCFSALNDRDEVSSVSIQSVSRPARGLRLPTSLAALVEQRPYLFEGSIRENLALGGAGRLRDGILWESLEQVNLLPFVRNLGGLDYQILDGGKNLSEGQRYRLALARLSLTAQPFLLLDEPFAALDDFSVEAVCKTLDGFAAKRGIVVVSHVVPQWLRFDHVLDFSDLTGGDTSWSAHRAHTGALEMDPDNLACAKAPSAGGVFMDGSYRCESSLISKGVLS